MNVVPGYYIHIDFAKPLSRPFRGWGNVRSSAHTMESEDITVQTAARGLGQFNMAVDWEEVLRLYKAILRDSGGEFGFVSEGTMRYIVDALEHMKGDAFAKASFAIHEIATKLPLANGNKRLALALGDVLLKSEGYRVAWRLDETVKFMLRVARGEVSQKEVESWLRTRSKKTL